MSKNTGFSLVEMMISLLLCSVIISALMGVYGVGITALLKTKQVTRFRNDLEQLLDMMATDIRRAGYGGQAFTILDSGKRKLVFTSADQQCILLRYNLDESNVKLTDNEKIGYKLTENKLLAATGANTCDSGYWQSITDPESTRVTELSFISKIVSNATASLRSVDIVIKAQLIQYPDVSFELNRKVVLRNLEYH